jgi:hypothetical protein
MGRLNEASWIGRSDFSLDGNDDKQLARATKRCLRQSKRVIELDRKPAL